jgi:hypothetical protein
MSIKFGEFTVKKVRKEKRRVPRPHELATLLKFRKPILSAKRRRLTRALTIYDLRDIAKRRTPQAPFDYTDGAADQEVSLNRARRTFEAIEFSPNILRAPLNGSRFHSMKDCDSQLIRHLANT